MKTLALLVVSFLAVTLAKRQGPLPHKILLVEIKKNII